MQKPFLAWLLTASLLFSAVRCPSATEVSGDKLCQLQTEDPSTYAPLEMTVECLLPEYYTEQDAVDIAKVLYAECRGVKSVTEQACVVWTILNRVDAWGADIYSVVRSPKQFAFNENTVVDDTLLALAIDVLDRWSLEKDGVTELGRVLPPEYIYFNGDGRHNYFRDNYREIYTLWDYSLDSPYENQYRLEEVEV